MCLDLVTKINGGKVMSYSASRGPNGVNRSVEDQISGLTWPQNEIVKDLCSLSQNKRWAEVGPTLAVIIFYLIVATVALYRFESVLIVTVMILFCIFSAAVTIYKVTTMGYFVRVKERATSELRNKINEDGGLKGFLTLAEMSWLARDQATELGLMEPYKKPEAK